MMGQPQMATVSRPMCPRLKKLHHISRHIAMHNARKTELGEPISPRQLVEAILSARFMDEFNSDSKSTDGAKSRMTRSSAATPRELQNSFGSTPRKISPRKWIQSHEGEMKSSSSLNMSSTSSISLISRSPRGDCKMRLSYQDDNWLSWSEGDIEALSPRDKNKKSSKCLTNPMDKLQEIQQELLQAEEFLQFEDDCHLAASENDRAYLSWLSQKNNVRKLNSTGKEEKIKTKKAVSQILKEVAENKYIAPPVPSYDEWRRQKNDEMRAAKLKEERKRKEEQALRAKRIALNEAAFAKWYRDSRDKPKPLPVISATRLSAVQSGPTLLWNPVPWNDEWSRERDVSPVRTRSEPDSSESFCIRTMLDDCKSRALSRRPSATENRAVKSEATPPAGECTKIRASLGTKIGKKVDVGSKQSPKISRR